MRKSFIICIGVAMLWGAFQALFYLGIRGEILLSDIILQYSFSDVSIILVYLIEMSIRLLPFLLFQILFGTYIYQHFCSASIYYFSRCHNRVKWFLKESLKLYVFALIYPMVMVISGTAVTSITNHVVFDKASYILLIYYLLIHSPWLFLTALLMNVIAIRLDSSYGFIVVAGLQLTSVGLLLLWENVWPLVDTPNLDKHVFLLHLNPISHLILAWHSSPIVAVNERLNHLNIEFSLNTSVMFFFFISLAVIAFGCFVVKKQEWITLSKER
jgi:hypothetical protein